MLLQRAHAHGIRIGKGEYGFVRAAARLLVSFQNPVLIQGLFQFVVPLRTAPSGSEF